MMFAFFFSSRRRHTILTCDWSSDVCSSDLARRLPGVRAASLSGFGLFSGSGWTNNIRVPGREVETFEPYYLGVSPGFFETMGLRLVEGHDFERRDAERNPPTAVVV